MNITIKDKAAEMLNNKLADDQFLRVGVKEGGCAGLTYNAEIVSVIKECESVVHTSGSVRIVADEGSEKFLEGLIVDYSDDLINGGLQFTNSNTQSTCGCGQSFGLSNFPEIKEGNCRS